MTEQQKPSVPVPAKQPSPQPDKTVEEKQKEVQEKAREEALKENQKVLNSIKEAKTPKDKEREDLLEKIGQVLREYGEESNIPINHEYWHLTGQYRALK